MVAAMTATAQDRLYINDFELAGGETKTIEIQLDNTTVFTALQADIFLPEGLSIEQEDGDYLFDLTDRKARNHTISSQLLSSGAIRILIASQTLKEFSGNSGALVTFNIIADANATGTKKISMNNIIASTADRVEYRLDDTECNVTISGSAPEKKVTALVTTSVDIPQGLTIRFNVGVNPADADNTTLEWTTSDATKATVDSDGNISLLEQGQVTITATTTDGSDIALDYVINITEAQSTGISYDLNQDGSVNVGDVGALYMVILGKKQ